MTVDSHVFPKEYMTQIRLTGPCLACGEMIMTQVFLSVCLPFSPSSSPPSSRKASLELLVTIFVRHREQLPTQEGDSNHCYRMKEKEPTPCEPVTPVDSQWCGWLSAKSGWGFSLFPVILFLQAKSKSLSSLTALATVGVLAFCSPLLGDTDRIPGTSPALTNPQASWLELE